MHNFLEKAKLAGLSALTGIASLSGGLVQSVVSPETVLAETNANGGVLKLEMNPDNIIKYRVDGQEYSPGVPYTDWFGSMTINGEWVFCIEPHISTNNNLSYGSGEVLSSDVVVRTRNGGTERPSDWTKMQSVGIYWAMLKADVDELDALMKETGIHNEPWYDPKEVITWFRSQDAVTRYGIMQMLSWQFLSGGKNIIQVVSAGPAAQRAVDVFNGRTFREGHIDATAIHYIGNKVADMWEKGILTYNNDAYVLHSGQYQRMLTTGGSFSFANGSVSMKKVPEKPELVAGNGNYSLEGAEYELYNETNSYRLVTNADGIASVSGVRAGNYKLRELKASQGFLVATHEVDVVVESGKNTEIPVESTKEVAAVGSVSLQKVSTNPDATNGNDNYSLEGAEFTLTNLDTNATYLVVTDKSGRGIQGGLPIGRYSGVETKASKGYAVNETPFTFEITPDAMSVEIPLSATGQTPKLGSFKMTKVSDNPFLTNGNSNYNLAGAQYTLTGNGKTFTLTTDANGYAEIIGKLPYGTYTFKEIKSPKGYVVSKVFSEVTISEETSVIEATSANFRELRDLPGYKELKLAVKRDSDLGEKLVHGDASVVGAGYEIRIYAETNLNAETVKGATPYLVVPATVSNNGELVITDTNAANVLEAYVSKDEDGYVNMPIGSYAIVETTAPTGYLLDEKVYVYNVTDNNSDTTTEANTAGGNAQTTTISEKVIRGGVQVTKVDAELGKSEAIGGKDHNAGSADGADLNGISFEITNKSANSVFVNGKEYKSGEVVATIVTSWNPELKAYTAQTAADTLPYGTYSIKEVSSNDSYNLTDTSERTFEIRENGKIVKTATNGAELTFANQIVRGDFEFIKIVDTTSERLSTAFVVTNVTTGEKHLIVTDKNGMFSSTDYKHSANTNANDSFIAAVEAGETIKMSDLNMKAGLWFGNAEDGSVASVRDDLGALPYGKYIISEVRTDTNEGLALQEFSFFIYKDSKSVDLGTVTDDRLPVEVGTTAIDAETKEHVAMADEEVTIIDTVSYKNVRPGKEYTVTGTLYVKETGGKLLSNGKEVTATTTFVPEQSNGSVDVTFTFNASDLKGKKVVAFEDLYEGTLKVASHADINDEGQTVYFPEIGTTLTDSKTKDHIASADKEITLIDTVAYKNLVVGKEYIVNGELYDQETGKSIGVTGQTTFTAETSEGSVEIVFTFDSSKLAGKSVVAFEDVSHKGIKVATHADINDKSQTVHIPKIGTTLVDTETKDHIAVADKEVTLVDTVAYTNLVVGKEYTVTGSLYNQETGEAIGVTGETKFTPTEKSGTVDVTFTFDASKLAGSSVVAFEDLFLNGIKVATHADINDEGQTVRFPEVKTTLVDDKSKTQEVLAEEKTKLVDTVEYKNLIVGKEYTVTGTLFDKETGAAIEDANGAQITASTTFVAEKANGSVDVVFEFASNLLAGKTVVAFEDLYQGTVKVGVHADINDKAQTVHFPKIGTTLVDVETKDHISLVGEKVTLIDTVSYTNLQVGKEYTVKGELYDKETGKSIDVKAETTFTPKEVNGTVDVKFEFDASKLAGTKVVAFETLYNGKNVVAVHADINDEGQTVSFPEVKTTLIDDASKTQTVDPDTEVKLVDTVEYKGLIVGKEYTVKGELYDKETGKSIDVKAETTFVAEKSDGIVEVVFTLDASKLVGKEIVAFEDLYQGTVKVGVHADINDKSQTVKVVKPEIGTTLVEQGTKSKEVDAKSNVTLIDTVAYKGLRVGKEYILKGELFDKQSGESTGVVGEIKFTPQTEDGTVDVYFNLDTTNLGGKSLVAFETLLDVNGKVVAEHKDINDKAQTVVVRKPEVPTTPSTPKQDTPKQTTETTPKRVTRTTVVTKNTPNTGVGGLNYTVAGAIGAAVLVAGGVLGTVAYKRRHKA